MNFLDNIRYRISTFSIAEKIILFNVFCFLIPMLLNTFFFLLKVPSGAYMNWIQLSPKFDIFITRPWTLISYSFFHSSFFHLLWNMLLLFYAGRLLLNLFPDKIFINNYFLGVIAGGLIFVLSYSLFPVFKGSYPPMIGASAGVMAVFIFICTYNPDREIRILFFNIKLKYLGMAFFLLDVIQIPYGNAGGHLAHIGGALLGFFMQDNWKMGEILEVDLSEFGNTYLCQSTLKLFINPQKKKITIQTIIIVLNVKKN